MRKKLEVTFAIWCGLMVGLAIGMITMRVGSSRASPQAGAPSPDQSLLPWIAAAATLGSAIVGGGVAIAAAWLSHYFTDTRERRRETQDLSAKRRERLRSKLEELITLVLDHGDSLSRNGTRIGLVGLAAVNPQANVEIPADEAADQLDKAEAIQVLYFPDLARDMERLKVATQAFRVFIQNEVNEMARDVLAWGRDDRATYGVRCGNALQPHTAVTAALVRAARIVIENELDD